MWSLFVGLGIGVMQIIALRALLGMIMGTHKALGALLLVLKFAGIAALLWLISTVSLMNLVWAAVGMLAGLVIGFVITQKLQKRTGKDGKDHGDA
jgi:hypothetical protein